ncbi:MAG TPA: hypothetical protein VIV60_14770, partial [Polyangiaceae bacterium]
GDADDIAPSLYGGRRRKSGTDIEKPVTEPTKTTTTTNPTNGTTTVPNGGQGSTVTLPTGVKPAIGMPGSDPFVR